MVSFMNGIVPPPNRVQRSFAAAAFSFVTHLFGALTCATCWAIFGPALALLLGSGATDFMAAMRALAPMSAAIASIRLAYSVYQLLRTRERHAELPYRMAVAFTAFSVVGWTVSAVFIATALVEG